MSRAKLFNLVKSRGEQPLGRNAFDLQNRHVYTQKVAKIYPLKAIHTMPKDYMDIEVSEFSQNNIPMNTAAFLSGKKELLAYFVPYNSIWHNFNQYQATREDPESAALKVKGISYEPRFSLYRLYHTALYFAVGAWMFEEYPKLYAIQKWYTTYRNHATISAWTDFMNAYGPTASLADLIQFMKDTSYASSNMSDWEFFRRESANIVADWSFDDLYNDGFPFNETWDCYEHHVEHNYDLTYGETILNMFGTPIWCDWIEKMDMLRYGNIYPIIHNWRVQQDKWLDDFLLHNDFTISASGILDSNSNSFADFLGTVFDEEKYAANFSSTINIPRQKIDAASLVNNAGDYTSEEYVNVYALYAYNKCFYDYMRNVYFDVDYNVYNYNCDFVDCTDPESSIIYPGYIPCRFYHLESHQWKKDMFTGVLPSNQLGAVSQVSVNVTSISGVSISGAPSGELNAEVKEAVYPDNTIGSRTLVYDNAGNLVSGAAADVQRSSNATLTDSESNKLYQLRTPHTHALDGSLTLDKGTLSVGGSASGTAAFDVLALKRAEALQQYAQDLMRAGNRTKDIFQQIYGSTPKSQLDETPYFIDVASNDLNINPIISTASTGQENNGRLGDIAARSIINGKPLSFKFSTEDFGVILLLSYIIPDSMYNSYNLDPCVCHLDPESHGLPYFQNLGLQPVIGSYLNNLKPISIRSRVCGYAPPYIERKTEIDLVHGNLVDTMLPKVGEGDLDSEYQGELSHWVVARTDMQQEDTVSLRNFYIDPRIVDNVFQFDADSDLSTDHYLTYASIKCNAVRALSELGLPRF